jgi:subtilisin family serine protease
LAQSNNVQILGRNKFMPLWYTLSCTKSSNGNAMKMANHFFESKLFAYSEPEFLIDNQENCTNDPLFSNQWGLNNTGQWNGTIGIDIDACSAWQLTKGNSNIVIAVFDEGIEFNHPDLSNIHPLSYDTESGTSPSKTLGSHGTACAGIIGANGNNNLGITGVAPNCTLMSISHSSSSYTRQKRADGINFAWMNGASVINNSWSWHPNFPLQIVTDAISLAYNNGRNGFGTILVFSTGNDDRFINFPASHNPDVIAVGAMNPCGKRKSKLTCDGENWGSNYGPQLDVVAPGVLIPTTDRQGALGYINIDFTPNFNGTSAAAPHVAGLAGLILSVEPELNAREVSDVIEKTARKIGGYTYNFNDPNHPNGFWHNEVGYGLIDAQNAVSSVYCSDTKLHNLTFNGTQSFSDCKILSNNSIVRTGKTTYTVIKKALLNNNFEVKSDAQFEIKTW